MTSGEVAPAPGVVGLDHVQLAMPQDGEAAARAFYADLLGLAEVAKPAGLARRGGLWLRAPGCELHLGVEEGFRPARKAHPGLLVRDLDGLAGRLAAAGHAVTWDTAIAGRRRLFTADPFGNRLELIEAAD